MLPKHVGIPVFVCGSFVFTRNISVQPLKHVMAVFCHNHCQFFKTTGEKPAGNGGIPEELRLFDFDSGLHCSKCYICESLLGISKYLKGNTNNMLQQCRSLKESSSTGTS